MFQPPLFLSLFLPGSYLPFFLCILLSTFSSCHNIYLSTYLSFFPSFLPSFLLSFFLSFFLSIYLSIYLSVCLSIYLSLSISIYLPIYLYLSTYLSLSIYLSISVYLFLSVCLSVCLSFYLSIFPSFYLSIYLFIHLTNLIYLCRLFSIYPSKRPRTSCFHGFDLKICFAPERHAFYPSSKGWCGLRILTWKSAARHNGGLKVFISDLATWLRTTHFSELFF